MEGCRRLSGYDGAGAWGRSSHDLRPLPPCVGVRGGTRFSTTFSQRSVCSFRTKRSPTGRSREEGGPQQRNPKDCAGKSVKDCAAQAKLNRPQSAFFFFPPASACSSRLGRSSDNAERPPPTGRRKPGNNTVWSGAVSESNEYSVTRHANLGDRRSLDDNQKTFSIPSVS